MPEADSQARKSPRRAAATAKARPLVLVPACNRMIGQHVHHVAGQKYVDAVWLAGCQPLIVPSVPVDEIDALLDRADGVLLTGSPSNVHPRHYGEAVHNPELPLDVDRDGWTLPLIPRVLARGMPLFAICRGFQEVNVALGGSLHQAVQEVPGQRDHRAPKDAPPEQQYGLAHEVAVQSGGVLAQVLAGAIDDAERIEVNSVHGQGIHRLADGLRIEALAPDGLIEAFSVTDAGGFNLCVQWHPEWQAAASPVSTRLFVAFGAACAAYRDRGVGAAHENPARDR